MTPAQENDQGTHAPTQPGTPKLPRVLLVIGMHRSGTSATTGALQRVGVPLGPKLYRGHQGINAKGYFEHSDIADTNEEVLLAIGSSWDDIGLRPDDWAGTPALARYKAKLNHYIQRDFGSDALWALKDPRIARMLPLWADLFRENKVTPAFLFSLRSPTNVAGSLERRDGFSRDKSMLLWLLHYLEAERDSRGQERSFLDYDQFLDNPVAQLSRVEAELNIQFPARPAECADQLGEFISKDLRTHRTTDRRTDESPFEALAQDLYLILKRAAEGGTEPDTAAIDDILQRTQALYASFAPVLVEHMHTCSARNGEVQLVLNKLIRSWSWVTGKPVRFVERLMGRDV